MMLTHPELILRMAIAAALGGMIVMSAISTLAQSACRRALTVAAISGRTC